MRLAPEPRALAALVLALASPGCDDKPRPWSGREGPAAVLAPPQPGGTGEAVEPAPQAPESPSGSPSDPADPSHPAPASSSPSAGDPGLALPAPAPSKVVLLPGLDDPNAPAEAHRITPGGGWVKCHEGLVLSGDPLKDVTRIGLLCGPSNGLRRKTRQAIVGVIGEGDPPVPAELRVARGACYRVIGVADEAASELDITVRSSRGVAVAADHSTGRLALAQPDRPFCTFADDIFTIDFSARRGSGRFAAEVWSVGEPRRRGDSLDAPADERPLGDP